eukprot:3343839-Pleurochrysis_carterae.AAC.4
MHIRRDSSYCETERITIRSHAQEHRKDKHFHNGKEQFHAAPTIVPHSVGRVWIITKGRTTDTIQAIPRKRPPKTRRRHDNHA